MFFRSPLRCARFLKAKSSRWTTALPTGAVRHPATGVKTSVSRRMLRYRKTVLHHLVARLPVNVGDNGRDAAAFRLAYSARHPANHLRASSRQAMRADLAMLGPHLGPSEIDGAPADLNNMKECGAPDDNPNWPTTIISYSNASKPCYSTCSDKRHTLGARGQQSSYGLIIK
jgi:hypothetical protein